MVEGKLQREGDVIHVIAEGCYDLSRLLRSLIAPKKANSSLFDKTNEKKVFLKGGILNKNLFFTLLISIRKNININY
jgi:hypothetical protein